MKRKPLVMGLIAVAVLGAAGYGAYMFGMQRGMSMTAAPAGAGSADNSTRNSGPQNVEQSEEPRVAHRHRPDAGYRPATRQKILYYRPPPPPPRKGGPIHSRRVAFPEHERAPVYARAMPIRAPHRQSRVSRTRVAHRCMSEACCRRSIHSGHAYNDRDRRSCRRVLPSLSIACMWRATLDRVARPPWTMHVRLDRCAGRIPVGPAHAGDRSRAAGRRSAPAHAAGRYERTADPARRK